MIYRTLCTFLRWYIRFFYPKARVEYADILLPNKPYILVCNCKSIFRGALFLAVHMPYSLRFVKKYNHTLHPFRQLILKALHIIPLLPLSHRIERNQQAAYTWKNLRELVTENHPLVFFTDENDFRISKGAAKLAFHTESVFDFHLNVEILPVNITFTTRAAPIIYFSEGISVSHYEREYKQHPARTIRYLTNHLKVLLSPATRLKSTTTQLSKHMVS